VFVSAFLLNGFLFSFFQPDSIDRERGVFHVLRFWRLNPFERFSFDQIALFMKLQDSFERQERTVYLREDFYRIYKAFPEQLQNFVKQSLLLEVLLAGEEDEQRTGEKRKRDDDDEKEDKQPSKKRKVE
jgi:hypothetical protein